MQAEIKYVKRNRVENKDAVISIRSLKTVVGGNLIHNEIDFDLYKGELLSVIGASGSGKSLLLRVLLGLQNSSGGSITYCGGEDKWDENFYGVLFQDGALFSSLSVKENILLPITNSHKFSRCLQYKLVQTRLLQMGLQSSDMYKYPAQLSGGMRKRVALARALAGEPKLLFLDEPVAGLDSISAERFNKLIKDLQKSLGLTIIMVTHDINSLYEVSDRIAVLYEGKIIACGDFAKISSDSHDWIKNYFAATNNNKRYNERL